MSDFERCVRRSRHSCCPERERGAAFQRPRILTRYPLLLVFLIGILGEHPVCGQHIITESSSLVAIFFGKGFGYNAAKTGPTTIVSARASHTLFSGPDRQKREVQNLCASHRILARPHLLLRSGEAHTLHISPLTGKLCNSLCPSLPT